MNICLINLTVLLTQQFLSKLSTCSASRLCNWKLKSGVIQGTLKNMRWGLKIAGVTVVTLQIWYTQYVIHQIIIKSTWGCHFAARISSMKCYSMTAMSGWREQMWSLENSNSNQQHMAGNLPTWFCALLRVRHVPSHVSMIDRQFWQERIQYSWSCGPNVMGSAKAWPSGFKYRFSEVRKHGSSL